MENIVAVSTDHDLDKYALFENILDDARFYQILDREWKQSGKSKSDFCIAVKPNISMMLRRDDVGTYTDTFLVIYLIRRMIQRGFKHIVVVESQNLYGNWFHNRSVVQVAARAGYYSESIIDDYHGEKSHLIHIRGDGVDHVVPIVDLTLDKVPYTFPDGDILLGETWIKADFRLNMSALKAHFYGHYTIAIKNIYGCLPEQDKVVHYHCKRKVAEWTAQLIHDFPVHFSIAAGYSGADGWFGVKMKAIFSKPHTFIAGEDILAVDKTGAALMGLDPETSIMYQALKKKCPPKPYRLVGQMIPFEKWRKVPAFLVKTSILIENSANLMDYGGSIATGGNDKCFPLKKNNGGSHGNIINKNAPYSVSVKIMGALKWLSYYLSIPISYFIDIGIVQLRIRKRIFEHKIRKNKSLLPLIAGSSFIISKMVYIGPEEIDLMIGILNKKISEKTTFSGHILFNGQKEFVFPSRLFTANIAAADIFNHLIKANIDIASFKRELDIYKTIYANLFGNDTRYAYCFR